MFWRCLFGRRKPHLGEHHKGTASVVRALLPLDEATLFHARDVMGQSAALPVQPTGQLRDPNPAGGFIGEPGEHVEILQRQPGIGLQLPMEGARKPGLHVQPTTPQTLFVVVQPGVWEFTRPTVGSAWQPPSSCRKLRDASRSDRLNACVTQD